MPLEKTELRRVMGHFATGVTIITTHDSAGQPLGLTANSVTSVSLEPPLLLFCIDKSAECFASFESSGAFVVNILSEEQEELSRRFAAKDGDKFSGVGFDTGPTGCARLHDSVGWLECRIVRSYDEGDHTIYIGEVEAADADQPAPLLFFRGGYRSIAS